MSSKKISAADQASYQKLLSDFNHAKESFERAKARKAEAEKTLKNAGAGLDSHDRFILDKTFKKAKHFKKYKEHELSIARKRLKDLRLPDDEKSYSLADAEGHSQQSPADEQDHKLHKKEKKEKRREKEVGLAKAGEEKSKKKAHRNALGEIKETAGNEKQPGVKKKDASKNGRVESIVTPVQPLAGALLAVSIPVSPTPPAGRAGRKRSTAPKPETAPDDLKQIEGVGLRIEELLKAQGVLSVFELARTSPERLKEILATGGPRYAVRDPQSWPQQALLLHEGKTEELNRLKAALKSGRTAKS